MRDRITVESDAGKYFKWGELVQIGDSEPLVFKKVKNGQMTVAKPILNVKQRAAMHRVIYWLNWPSRHIFRPIEWWIWERRNAVLIKGFRLVVDEIMRRKRVERLEGKAKK